jgi:glycosyltransferase involved in cell wall biosynthesis
LVQEINEWYHNDLNRKLEKFIIEGPLVKQSSAAIVISETIKKRVSEINPKLKVLKIPVLEDFTRTSNIDTKNVIGKRYCFWMGDVDGYKNDVFFILKACAQVYSKGIQMYFYVCGPCSIETLSQIKELASQLKYPILQLKILGYLSEEELNTYCNNASLFVVPLWDDERSKSRFPTKIGSFMKTGKPVISCKIGEISNLLSDNHTVLYYRVADYNDLAVKIERLSNDNELYERLSKESYDFASKYFNYLSYSEDLRLFFNNI